MENVDDDLVSETDMLEDTRFHHQLKQSVCHIPLKGLLENALLQTYFFLLIWILTESLYLLVQLLPKAICIQNLPLFVFHQQ